MKDGLKEFELAMPDPHFAARAHVHKLAESNRRVALERIREITGSEVPEDRLFTWQAEISNRSLDSYFTRMAESSLQNYAADADTGVVFLDSHDHKERIGYSLSGLYEGGDEPRVLADFYTVSGLNLASIPTDQFIDGVKFGLIRDVSIGFKEGEGFQYTCSICRMNLFSWDCDHIPSMTYEVSTAGADDDPTGEGETEERMCFAWIENARLSEVSSVYDGATTNAMIIKATRELRGGRLQPNVQRMLESAYRMELPASAKQFRSLGNPIENGENEMNGEGKPSGAPDNRVLDANARSVAIEAGVKLEGEPDALGTVRTMAAEIKRLAPFETQAHDGRVLRAALVEETIAEGVRAYGKDFNVEAKQRMLENLDVDTVREMRDSWKEMGDKALGGGRRSEENPDPPQTEGEDDAPAGGGETPAEDDRGEQSGEEAEELLVPEDAIGNV